MNSPSDTNKIRGRPDRALFEERLRLLCEQNGGAPSFAATAGVPYRTLARYFHGSNPSRDILVKLASAANVSLDWLCGLERGMGGEGDPIDDFALQRHAFISNVRELGKRCGTLKALSEAAEIPYQTLKRYLRGSEPTRDPIIRMAKAGGVSTDWLLGMEPPITEAPAIETEPDNFFILSTRNRGTISIRLGKRLRDIARTEEAIDWLAKTSMIPREDLEEILDGNEPTLEELVRISITLNMSVEALLKHP